MLSGENTPIQYRSVDQYLTVSGTGNLVNSHKGTVPRDFWPVFMALTRVAARAVDPLSFFADPDPAVHLNADPDR